MRNKFSILFLLLSVSYLSLFAELHINDNIRFDHLSIKDGLSQSAVNALLEDDLGFIWFGTQDGLNRYNGFEFLTYWHNPDDTNSISNNNINCLYLDEKGRIWVGTDFGLNVYFPEQDVFKQFLHSETDKNTISSNIVKEIFKDSYGIIWIGNEAGGLNAYNEERNTFSRFLYDEFNPNSLSNNTINTIFEDNEHNLWIGTNGGGLNLFDRENNLFIRFVNQPNDPLSLSNNVVWDIYEDSNNRLWVATNNGLSLINNPDIYNKKVEFINLKRANTNLGNNIVRKIFEDPYNQLWVGTKGGGLNKVTIDEKNLVSFEAFKHNPFVSASLCNDFISDIYLDHSGTFWIATQNGLSKFNQEKQSFYHYTSIFSEPNSLPDKNVWSIYKDKNGILWTGTRKGLSLTNLETGKVEHYNQFNKSPNFQNDQSVICILEDHDNSFWVGTVDGLFNAKRKSENSKLEFTEVQYCIPYFHSGTENKIYALFEDNKHQLWVGTRNGLAVLNSNRDEFSFFQYNINQPKSLSNNIIRSIFQDNKGNIWVGTEGGLNRVIQNGKSIQFEVFKNIEGDKNSLSNDAVYAIKEDRFGNIWVGTYGGGLNRFNYASKTFNRIEESQNPIGNVVLSILIDASDKLWIGTNRGLNEYDPVSGTIVQYRENDGLQSDEFNAGAAFASKDGLLFFGGIDGLNYFNPLKVNTNNFPPKVVISGFHLFNQPTTTLRDHLFKGNIAYLKQIKLEYYQNNFTIEFAGLHYSYPEKNEYRYKMDGFDEDWNYVGNKRFANYTNLDPGTYEFKVQSSNIHGVWSATTASIKIEIVPPFYASLWFRVLALFVILGIILIIYRWRVNVIRTQKRILEYKVRKRTSEVLKQKKEIERQKFLLEQEKEKTEKLLLNILPSETVEELKVKGKATARSYRLATIMFTDIKNFTRLSEKLRPRQIVQELDSYFVKFDEIIEKYNIEKIKTIGDSYMAVGGIPIRNTSNPIDVVLAGLEIQRYMVEASRKKHELGEPPWDLRIGINTGELVAGVVGIKRFAYDVWGDSVNIAHRMEVGGDIGKVNISGVTYDLIKEFFDCTYRGKVLAKNKGEVDMYFVDQVKPELSENGEGTEPNQLFWDYVNLKLYSSINYKKAEKHILKLLEDELPEGLFYHGIHHTLDVCNAVEKIAHAEGVKGEELFLLKTAALVHDAGFTKTYANNEPYGVEIAREILPHYGYSDSQIEMVGDLILATKVPQKPKTKLQMILCDADLDYLGRNDFHQIANTLRDELLAFNLIDSEKHWDEIQVKFLSAHNYFTEYCKKNREPQKRIYIQEIKDRLKYTS